MANTLGTAYVQIKPTTKGISGEISKELSGAGDKAGEESGKSFASRLKAAIVGAGIGTALVRVTKQALEAGGALQQSFGGLDTIYGEASGRAKEFAMQAAEMGISANDYAEQAVAFGASLKQALGGDVQSAANVANLAIKDMADNAAKMGTPIENIQTAYQGFAKQNYTMLDNLKLGYGGTKTEMERLLKDAEKLSGEKFDIKNLDDVYTAIHVIQGELGLTGVAADEAKTTLTGSFGAMKASAENFLATLTTGGDISGPLAQLMTTAGTFLINNLIPMLTNFAAAIPGALSQVLTTVGPQIGTAFTNVFNSIPGIIESGTKIINDLVNGIISGLPGFLTTAYSLLGQFVGAVLSNLPTVLQSGVDIILNLVNGIIQNLPQIVSSAAQAAAQFAAGIAQKLPTILQEGIKILAQLAAGLIAGIPKAVAAIPSIINGIKSAFSGFDWRGIGGDILRGIANGLKAGAGIIVDAAKNAAKSALNAAKSFLGIKSPSRVFADQVGKMIPAGVAVGIEANTKAIDAAMRDLTADMTGAFMTGYSGSDYSTTGNSVGGYNQTVNIYSPQALTPAEVARQTRNQTQQMLLAVNGV